MTHVGAERVTRLRILHVTLVFITYHVENAQRARIDVFLELTFVARVICVIFFIC